MKRTSYNYLLVCILTIAAFAQKEDPPKLDPATISGPVPIVFGSPDDGFPDKITVHGIIRDLTFAQAYCGIVAWSGTLKIELTQKIENYPSNNVFLVEGCFYKPELDKKKYLDKEIQLEVYKISPLYQFGTIKDINKVPCAFDIITNKIKSDGVPFYCSRGEISKSIEKFEKFKEKN
jgi:hypothetical protein